MILIFSIVTLTCGRPVHSVTVVNNTGQLIRNVIVRYEGYESTALLLRPTQEGTEVGVQAPIPESAMVEWDDAAGIHRVAKVFVQRSQTNSSGNSTLILTISANSVVTSHVELEK